MRVADFGILAIAIVNVAALSLGFEIQIARGTFNGVKPVSTAQKVARKGAQLFMRMESEPLSADKPALLVLSFRNNTKEPLFLEDTYPERDYKFDVRDEQDESVPLTENGRRLVTNTSVYKNVGLKIEPGKQMEHQVDINGLYDLTGHGTYRVTAKRKVLRQDGSEFEITSNTIKFKVIP